MHKVPTSVSLEQSLALVQQEKKLGSASKRLEALKLQLSKQRCNEAEKTGNRWRKAKAWSPCPIGMLPRIIGSSGRLPLLSIMKPAQGNNNNAKRGAEWSSQQLEMSTIYKRARMNAEEDTESNDVSLETYEEEGSDMDMEEDAIEKPEAKKNMMFEDEDEEESRSCLMIGGEWKRVKDEELLRMASSVRILKTV